MENSASLFPVPNGTVRAGDICLSRGSFRIPRVCTPRLASRRRRDSMIGIFLRDSFPECRRCLIRWWNFRAEASLPRVIRVDHRPRIAT